MKEIKIPKYTYKNGLGTVILKNISVLFLDESDAKKYKAGTKLESLQYALPGEVIEEAEKTLAVEFFKNKFRAIFDRKYELNTEELVAIQQWLGLNNIEFSKILGVDKGSYSNILKRKKLLHATGLHAVIMLGNDLLTPGAAKRLVDMTVPLKKADPMVVREIKLVLYGNTPHKKKEEINQDHKTFSKIISTCEIPSPCS